MTEPTGLDLLGRLLPTLALLLGGLLLVRHLARRGGSGRPRGGVRVVARTGLTRGAVVAVVAAGRRRFLVGAGDSGVALLAELDAGDLESPPDVAGADAAAGVDGRDSGLPHALGVGLPPQAMIAARATERRAHHRPWTGLVDRLRAMTVRTHLQGPVRAARR